MSEDEFLARVAEVVGDRGIVAYSGAGGLAEISAPGVTKAAALESWCDGLGIGAEDVWAFGDMPNDLPMIVWAGTSFAVANAHPDVIAAADHVCPSNDEDGVAQVLERLLDAPEREKADHIPRQPLERRLIDGHSGPRDARPAGRTARLAHYQLARRVLLVAQTSRNPGGLFVSRAHPVRTRASRSGRHTAARHPPASGKRR